MIQNIISFPEPVIENYTVLIGTNSKRQAKYPAETKSN